MIDTGVWRVGRDRPTDIYRQIGDEPSERDVYIGRMETAEDADQVVVEHNVTWRGA